MDYSLTEDQEMLRDAARNLLSKEVPTSLVREHVENPSVADAVWQHLREWTELAQGPLVDLCLFLEETGAVNAPGPFFPTVALYGPLLQALGRELNDSGTVAMAGRSGEWVVSDDPVRTFVPEVDRVDTVAIVVPGPAVVLVPAASLSPRLIRMQDFSRRLFEVEVPAGGEQIPIEQSVLDEVMERAAVALAAEMLGTTRWLFDTTLQYAKERVQFDKPIGSFQAVQHKLANMALARERAWSAVYYAAMAFDAGEADRHRAAHVAKASAGEAATLCAKDGIQIHGGIGYTWEHDLHFYIRRAYGSEALLGTTGWHHDRLADLLLV
jgi:alkylation response protein AidB-like acyl-CoA dehydrogenase